MGPPQQLWDQLRPTHGEGTLPILRDTTDFTQIGSFDNRNPYWMSVDAEGGFVFAATNAGFEVWDARTNPGNPTQLANLNFYAVVPFWSNNFETKFYLHDVDCPPGNSNVCATAGRDGVGLLVFDTTVKNAPRVLYQDHGATTNEKYGYEVYAANIGGQAYAFMASENLTGGTYVYNLTAAQSAGTPFACVEARPQQANPACAGVFLGKLGSRTKTSFIDGTGNFVVHSSGTSPRGFEIFNVANPSSPFRVLEGLTGDIVYGVSLFQQGANFYLALRVPNQGRIYNVSCIANNSCGSLGSPIWTMPLNNTPRNFITYSMAGSTPFLYFGVEKVCAGPGDRDEWLFDVSNPANPQDITPPSRIINGELTGYWGWNYPLNSTGHNFVYPRRGKFAGNFFYRAAHAIFDIHELTSATPPMANFVYSPAQVYPGTQVDFTDTSTGAPFSWSWTFEDGVPSTSSQQSPQNVTFATQGSKTVSLTVQNGAGFDTENREIPVLSPIPSVTSISVSPNPALRCQPITFTANGATGQPPLTFNWVVRDDQGNAVPGGSSIGVGLNPFVWDMTTPGPIPPAGSYTIDTTLTNSAGNAGEDASFTINPLPALDFTGPGGAPTNEPFTAGTVQFHVQTQGATEWRWDFGDGTPEVWTNDPVNGPNPVHTYTQTGSYDVSVRIRNCEDTTGIPSNTLTINVTSIAPLVANFQAVGGVFCSSLGCAGTIGQPITFEDRSLGDPDFYDYDWDGNGSFEDANNANPETSHTYNQAGTYTPTLRVRRGTESDTFEHQQISIAGGGGGGGGSGMVTISGPTTGTVGQQLTYTAGSTGCSSPPSSWSWTANGGTSTASGNTLTVTYDTTGTKQIRVVANNGNCQDEDAVRNVNITSGGGGGGGELDANFTFSPSNPQVGTTVTFDGRSSTGNIETYSWNFGDGSTGAGSLATHAYTASGTYTVTLAVIPPGCFNPGCTDAESKTVTVTGGTPLPTVSADFTVNVPCSGSGALIICEAEAGQVVSFSDTSTISAGELNSWFWSFGDGTTANGRNVNHAFAAAGSFQVTLTAGNGTVSGQARKRFTISEMPPPPPPQANLTVLPWVVQGDGALVQSSTFYVHNPDTQPMSLILRFLPRPSSSAEQRPEVELNLPAGATAYFPDLMQEAFGLNNVTGSLQLEVTSENMVEPVAVSYHRTFQPDGTSFGQAVGAVPINQFPKSSQAGTPKFHLVGLNDNDDRLGFFGITNPTDTTATVQLRFYNQLGEPIGNVPEPFAVAAFGQRQFQVRTIRENFGISHVTDYRVDVEVLEGGAVYPYGANLRLRSGDFSYVRPGDPTLETVYLIGALATNGANFTTWVTDAVISNLNSFPVSTDVSFVNVGNSAEPLETQRITLLGNETLRLGNILVDRWQLDAESSLGLLTFKNLPTQGVFPLIQGETYEVSDPNVQYGQFIPAFTEEHAAEAGEKQVLVGLQQDEGYRTTVWLVNPGDTLAEYDLVYRALDGTILDAQTFANFRVGPGKMRQINPSQHPFGEAGVEGGFTLQIRVRSGAVLSAAQVVNFVTNDPAFVAGQTR